MTKHLINLSLWGLSVATNPAFLELVLNKHFYPSTAYKLWTLSILLLILAALSTFYGKLKPFMARYSNFTGLFFSFYLFVFLLLILEFAFHYALSQRDTNPEMFGEKELVKLHADLGYAPKPDTAVTAAKVFKGDTIYRTRYIIDKHARRLVEDSVAPSHLLFFGGSFTFGQGVGQGQSFPEITGISSKEHQSYNYGFFGYGPQQMLLHLQRNEFKTEVAQRSGAAIYTLIDHHFLRNPPALSTFSSYGERLPFYDYDKNGQLAHFAPMRFSQPSKARLYKFLGGSKTLEYFQFDIPASLAERDFERMAEMMLQAKNQYQSLSSPENPFVVLLFPGTQLASQLIPHLEKRGVTYFDYSQMAALGDERFFFKYDGHPNVEMHRKVAHQLINDLANLP